MTLSPTCEVKTTDKHDYCDVVHADPAPLGADPGTTLGGHEVTRCLFLQWVCTVQNLGSAVSYSRT